VPPARPVGDLEDVQRHFEDVQRVAAYGVLRDGAGRAVLVRASDRSDLQGHWFLPGGGVDFGEHPRAAVVREVDEETGVDVEVTRLRDVLSDVVDLPHRGRRVHTLRVVYDLHAAAGRVARAGPGPVPAWTRTLRPEPDGTSDAVRLLDDAAAAALPLMPFVARVLGLPVPRTPVAGPPARPLPHPAAVGVADLDALHDDALARVQRTAAYAVCVADHRLLLTRLVHSHLWTLPGGGVDHGEDVRDAVVREVREEAGLPLTIADLLDVDSVRFTGRAPSGRLEDFHGVRVVFTGTVPTDVEPHVVEVGGSTAEAAWVRLDAVDRIRVAGLVRVALRSLR